MPCNFNQRELAQQVKAGHPRGRRHADGVQHDLGLRRRLDGHRGHARRRSSAREVIADSIELVVRGHLLDGLVCIVGCDKTIPAAVMALARLDMPGLVFYNGSIAPGTFRGQRRHDPGRLRGGRRATPPGKIDARGAARARVGRLPGRRRLRRPVHRQHDGDGARLPRHQPGRPERHPGAQPRQGRRGRGGRPPRDAARARGHAPVADHHARGARERGRVGGGDRRLDERRAAPARDRARARHPVLDRRLRRDRGAHADRRRA